MVLENGSYEVREVQAREQEGTITPNVGPFGCFTFREKEASSWK